MATRHLRFGGILTLFFWISTAAYWFFSNHLPDLSGAWKTADGVRLMLWEDGTFEMREVAVFGDMDSLAVQVPEVEIPPLPWTFIYAGHFTVKGDSLRARVTDFEIQSNAGPFTGPVAEIVVEAGRGLVPVNWAGKIQGETLEFGGLSFVKD